MNVKRIIAGGLLAGLVMNIGEFILNVPVIGADYDAALRALGLPPVAGGAIALFVALLFMVGILAIWMYAAMRTTRGAGPRTALEVAILVWILAFAFPTVGLMAMGVFPPRVLMIAIVWQLVEVPLAVLAGAWVYRAEPAAVRAAA